MTVANVAAEQGVQDAASLPRSGRVAMAAFYGLVVMLLVVLWYSPLEVVWWILLVSIFAGFMASEYVFTRARSNARARRGTGSGAWGSREPLGQRDASGGVGHAMGAGGSGENQVCRVPR